MPFDANEISLFKFVNRDVHPNDEMFKTAKISLPQEGQAFHYYFYSGGRLAERLRDYLLSKGCRPARMSALDFACGYGRVTRYLDLIFQRVTVSDLEQEMLDFASKRFAQDTILSGQDPHKLDLGLYDLVFSFSLLTHLNPDIWQAWFARLAATVRPGGVLVFSTQNPHFARERGIEFDDSTGISFVRRNETSGRLDVDVYGDTAVNRAFVDAAAARHGGLHRLEYFSRGTFDMYHDMHIFKRA